MASCTAKSPVQGPPWFTQHSDKGSSCTVYRSYPNATLLLNTCCNTTTNDIVPNSLRNWTDTISGTVIITNYSAENGCAYEYCDTTGSDGNNLFGPCVMARFSDANGTSCFERSTSRGNVLRPGLTPIIVALCIISAFS